MNTNEKIDLFKLHKGEYAATKKPAFVTVKKGSYLAIAGRGAPGGPEFTTKIGSLYATAYTVKMTRKFAGQPDYTIGKLEMQYWVEDERKGFENTPMEEWRWKMLIRTPEFVKTKELKDAVIKLREKNKAAEADQVKIERLNPGRCAQMLHVGPYDKIGETCLVMKQFAEANGLVLQGLHHEIYLSDPGRVPPERLKTIIREPVAKG